jgi:pyruvate,water dikinase
MRSTLILPIDQLESGKGGGKAYGLSLLKRFGFKIPETYVITDYDNKQIALFVDSLDDKAYAVRSSASVEDGIEHSFAGQFESFLGKRSKENIVKAIRDCFASADSANAKAYNKTQLAGGSIEMNVIVQEMVETRFSGVLFTANPVAGRYDTISLSISQGIGEDLMAGHTEGENHLILKHSADLPKSKFLSEKLFSELIRQAKAIEEEYGKSADMEWAVDANDHIYWLQLRPITSLPEVHYNELDHKPLFKDPIYTRGNIGEMMPGPVTPLTLSTFARAIEVGLQVFYNKIGALKRFTEENLFVHSYYNHLFFDMERLYESTRHVHLSKKENIDYAIVGEVVPDKVVRRETSFIRGLVNFIKMSRYISSAPKAWKNLKTLHDSFKIECPGNVNECYKIIDSKLQVLFDAYSLHYVTSSQSGALYSTILNIHSKNKIPQRHHQEKVAKLFNNIPDVESANVLKSLDELAKELSKISNIRDKFLDVGINDSLTYLEASGDDEIIKRWKEFIKRHGHRCIREAELHELEWSVDPLPLVEGLRTKTLFLVDGHKKKINGYANKKVSLNDNGLNWFSKKIVSFLLPKARIAVARREQTKAWSIGIQYQFKTAYRTLARKLVKNGLLDDPELIFFLTHQEIGELIGSEEFELWNKKAEARRKLYPELQKLAFPDLSFGIPVPESTDSSVSKTDGALTGIPVSQGIVEGRVRIVNNLEEARQLKKHEIMVAKFTDIGWTPHFSIISGLITEIGSPLSHGAVVAREYGLPAIVSMKGAMTRLKTGQRIKLDAVKGEVFITS